MTAPPIAYVVSWVHIWDGREVIGVRASLEEAQALAVETERRVRGRGALEWGTEERDAGAETWVTASLRDGREQYEITAWELAS